MTVALVRIDSHGARAWQVRIGQAQDRRAYESRFFSDSRYGGPEQARRAAQRYLRSLGLKHRGRVRGIQFYHDPSDVPAHNRSGVTGVYKSFERKPSGSICEYWAAFYTVDRQGRRTHGCRRFYCTKRGNVEAFRLAIAFRRGFERAYRTGGIKGVMRFWRRRQKDDLSAARAAAQVRA